MDWDGILNPLHIFKCSTSFLTFLYRDVVYHADVADAVAFNAVAVCKFLAQCHNTNDIIACFKERERERDL